MPEWNDLTGPGGKYEAEVQDPPRSAASYWACGGSVHTGEMPTDSTIAKQYIKLVKSEGCLTEMLKFTGYNIRSLDRLRVVLTRINKRCNDMFKGKMGEDAWRKARLNGSISNLTGLNVNGDWKITPVRQKKEKDEAFADILAWMQS